MAPRKKKEVEFSVNIEFVKSDFDLLNSLRDGAMLHIENELTEPLVSAGLVERNPNDIQGSKTLTRITQKGIDFIMAKKIVAPTVATESAAVIAAPKFATGSFADIASMVAEKAPAKGRGRKAMYPFDETAVNAYFKVEASEKMPNPIASLAGTVNAANKRYEVATGETKVVRRKIKGTDEYSESVKPVMKAERKFEIKTLANDTAAYIVRVL